MLILSIRDRVKAVTTNDEGFTPLEILGGLAMIAILIGFLVVRFLGWRETAQDRDAQATARAGVLVSEGVYTNALAYNIADITADSEVGASVTLLGDSGNTSQNMAIVSTSDSGTVWGMVLHSDSAMEFCNFGATAPLDFAAADAVTTCNTDSFQGL